jgi:tetratricopeptide (TPR) repeat protein
MRNEGRHPTTTSPIALGAAGLTLLLAACGADPAPEPAAADPEPAATAPAEEAAQPEPAAPAEAPTEQPADEQPADEPQDAAPAETAPPEEAAAPERLPEPSTEDVAREDPVPPAPTLSPEHEEAVTSARALRDEGRRPEAVQRLREAEERHGAHGALRLEAAWTFFEMAVEAFDAGADPFLVKGNLADAHLRVDQAAALQADLPGAAVLLAKILRYEEDPDTARKVLVDHLARWSGDIGAHRELGDMAQNARDWALADTHFTKAATLDPSDGRSRLNATVAKQWLSVEGGASYGREELHAGYRMAARLLPDEDDPLRLLVGLYPNDPGRRLAALDEVIEDNPDAVWARVWKAYLLRGSDPAAALDVLAEAQRIQPENTAVIVNRAETLAGMERWTDAIDAYVQALEVGEPGTLVGASDALDALLHLGAQSRDLPIATRDRAYDALCDANPSIGRYGNNAGLWYRDVGQDYEKSLRYYQRSVDAEPDDQDYLNDTALIYLFHLRDRKEQCLPMFEKVRRLVEVDGQEPIRGYWDTLENLCKYYFETGRFEQVLECAELRADDRATLNGKPYPSMRAAAYANQARRKLAESE